MPIMMVTETKSPCFGMVSTGRGASFLKSVQLCSVSSSITNPYRNSRSLSNNGGMGASDGTVYAFLRRQQFCSDLKNVLICLLLKNSFNHDILFIAGSKFVDRPDISDASVGIQD